MALVDRAAAAGHDTLLVTVDVPVAGARLRDQRNGFSIPPALTASTVLNAIPRPEWWFNFLTTRRREFTSLRGGCPGRGIDGHRAFIQVRPRP
jgi:L-lactate dehydrogenase (cytochrome)